VKKKQPVLQLAEASEEGQSPRRAVEPMMMMMMMVPNTGMFQLLY
jgi:hypothetical protein